MNMWVCVCFLCVWRLALASLLPAVRFRLNCWCKLKLRFAHEDWEFTERLDIFNLHDDLPLPHHSPFHAPHTFSNTHTHTHTYTTKLNLLIQSVCVISEGGFWCNEQPSPPLLFSLCPSLFLSPSLTFCLLEETDVPPLLYQPCSGSTAACVPFRRQWSVLLSEFLR